jgi:hypothetical protein
MFAVQEDYCAYAEHRKDQRNHVFGAFGAYSFDLGSVADNPGDMVSIKRQDRRMDL